MDSWVLEDQLEELRSWIIDLKNCEPPESYNFFAFADADTICIRQLFLMTNKRYLEDILDRLLRNLRAGKLFFDDPENIPREKAEELIEECYELSRPYLVHREVIKKYDKPTHCDKCGVFH